MIITKRLWDAGPCLAALERTIPGLPSVTDCITGGVDARKLAEMVGARRGTTAQHVTSSPCLVSTQCRCVKCGELVF